MSSGSGPSKGWFFVVAEDIGGRKSKQMLLVREVLSEDNSGLSFISMFLAQYNKSP